MSPKQGRVEWPSQNPELLQLLSTCNNCSPKIVDKDVKIIVNHELFLCTDEDGEVNDNDFNKALTSLYYRSRVQSTVWDVFVYLNLQGLVKFDAFRAPISLDNPSQDVIDTTGILRCFEIPSKEASSRAREIFPLSQADAEFETKALHWLSTVILRTSPNHWLSTVILRTSPNPGSVMNAIRESGILGPINDPAIREFHRTNKGAVEHFFNLNEGATDSKDNDKNEFGFWLPRGIGNENVLDKIAFSTSRFLVIEKCFKIHFKILDSDLSSRSFL